ncbi:MAG TPA: molybdopterin cofactor-binding domain-containing protein [Dehalococcoidia bacterium]|nr:molybdopterin cofactor-binding domain-containing protein [Dehalococcoidia bacterium]
MTEQQAGAATEGLIVAGEVTVGFPAQRTGYGAATYGNTEPQRESFTWLVVHPDGTATAFAGKVEYGQGIRWGLAVEVADELRLPLDAVEVVLGDTDRVPWDMGTFGSQSTARVGVQLRKAAATAREKLLELAADRLDLPTSDLSCEDGRVIASGDANHAVEYAELLAGERIEIDIVDDVALTPETDFTVMGTETARIDAEMRVTGAAVYSQDVQVPEMLFAHILRPPSYGATAATIDLSVAAQMPGVAQTIELDGMHAILADSDEEAEFAARVVQQQWDEQAGQPSRWDMPQLLKSSAQEPFVTQEEGDLDAGFAEAAGILEETYYIPYITIAPMEPRAAVAQWDGDRLTIRAGGQRPFGLRSELAGHFGIDEDNIRVVTQEIGGGFGGKSIYPVAEEAATLARAAGRPVRVAYTRNEETTLSTFRPAALIEIKSGFTSDGRIVAWDYRAYHAGERVMIGRRGSMSPYDTPNVRAEVFRSDSPLRSGSYRSLGGAVNHFAREVHIDEIAAATGVDPVALRLKNMVDPRFRRVIETAAGRFGWGSGDAGSGRGIAIGLDVGSYSATAVQLDVQGTEVKVERVAASLDCGLTVNPDGARNQMEGGVVMGMGNALYEAADFEDGRLLNPGFTRYRVPRSNNAPGIEVDLVGDPETPSTGAGEPGIVPIAPAISNAVFDLTGERHRELPIQRHLS